MKGAKEIHTSEHSEKMSENLSDQQPRKETLDHSD